MKINNKQEHLIVISIFIALLTACTLTAQSELQKTPDALSKSLTSHSPYSAEGAKTYQILAESTHFSSVLEKQKQRCANPEATAHSLTHLGSLLSLQAWGEKDLQAKIDLAKQADAAFDRALSLSPHFWDAWMGKADIYAHSEDTALKEHAKSILKELTSETAKTSTPAFKIEYASKLLSTLQ